ncbi:hypothetical protein [Hymenobacter edaphi]|uniref:Uncharacterized protein n=1 Tax=Hymenobacter edaphi TaxID=2211146 RepID=A0A328BYH9_9BACT|nr:hypothetical protein [Hymenobacter edaphi]RAK70198.1 hypothetical protein DLM85_04950 [Hymenobacter edaphi]
MQLLRFSPAEVLLLQRTTWPPVRRMLRLTFADLILRDVLRLENRPFQTSPHAPLAPCYYVRLGNAAPTYQPRPHEQLLLQVLPTGRQMMLLRHYVGVLLESMPEPHRFCLVVAETLGLQGSILRNGWYKFFQSFALTHDGSVLRITLRQETDALITQMAHEVPAVATVLPLLYGNALLVGVEPPLALRLFDQEFLRALRANRAGSDWGADVSGSDADGGDADFGGGHSGGGGASADFGDDSGCSSGCSSSGCGGCGGGGD